MSDVVLPSAPSGEGIVPNSTANATTSQPPPDGSSSFTDIQFSIGVGVGTAITVILVLAAFRGILCRKIIHSRAYQELKRRMRGVAGEAEPVRDPELRPRERKRLPSLLLKEEEELREVHSIGVIPRRRVYSLEEPRRFFNSGDYAHNRSPSVWTLPTITFTPADTAFVRNSDETFSGSTEVLRNPDVFFRKSDADRRRSFAESFSRSEVDIRGSQETIRRSNENFRHFRKTGERTVMKYASRARSGSSGRIGRESPLDDIFSGRKNGSDVKQTRSNHGSQLRKLSVEDIVIHRSDPSHVKTSDWEYRNGTQLHQYSQPDSPGPNRTQPTSDRSSTRSQVVTTRF